MTKSKTAPRSMVYLGDSVYGLYDGKDGISVSTTVFDSNGVHEAIIHLGPVAIEGLISFHKEIQDGC